MPSLRQSLAGQQPAHNPLPLGAFAYGYDVIRLHVVDGVIGFRAREWFNLSTQK